MRESRLSVVCLLFVGCFAGCHTTENWPSPLFVSPETRASLGTPLDRSAPEIVRVAATATVVPTSNPAEAAEAYYAAGDRAERANLANCVDDFYFAAICAFEAAFDESEPPMPRARQLYNSALGRCL